MTNYLGMNSVDDVLPAPDIITLAWARYDQAAMRLDRLIVEANDSKDAVVMAEQIELDRLADKEALMGECECSEHPDAETVCAKCAAYCRVIAWAALHR